MPILESKTIQKHQKHSITKLNELAQKFFNAYIRKRDAHLQCISCGTGSPANAGHFYSEGHYKTLRWNEDNVHGQCIRCNHFLHGNLNSYRINLEKKIGKEALLILDELAVMDKITRKRKETIFEKRIKAVEIIIKYKELCK